MTGVNFAAKVEVPQDVLIRDLEGESVLLNLASNQYFGLDVVGTDMWRALTTSASVQEAFDRLLAEYEVEPEVLQRDLLNLVENLVSGGLITLVDA